jgi:PKD repeat protein
VANFAGSPDGTAPLTVAFTDNSTGAPTSWTWTFGDGGTSTARNPSHVYTAAGTYSVTLTATNALGSDTITKANYIAVTPPVPPVAAFTGSPLTGITPLTISFTDNSTGAPTSWAWTFGDGGRPRYRTHRTSTRSPTHIRSLNGDERRRQQHDHEYQLHHRHAAAA